MGSYRTELKTRGNKTENSTQSIIFVFKCVPLTRMGINGNACLHQVAVALKYGISNLNFIPQTAKERFNIIAILAARNNTKFSVFQFVFSN